MLMVEGWSRRVLLKGENSVRVSCPSEIEMPVILRNTLLRIASGALSNSIKHSGALNNPKIQIEIEVAKVGNQITLQVIDNGKGTKEIIDGYGIIRMRQLIRQLNYEGIKAKITFSSELNSGFKVFVSALLPKRNEI